MGVLHGRDLFSPKWTTAIISDAANRVHFVPIKHVLGGYFLTELDGQMYAFKIDGRRVLQYRETAVRTVSILQYDIRHYLPLSSESKELEIVLETNQLPKVESKLAGIFKVLGSKEKEPFTPHKLNELIAQISEYNKSSRVGAVTPFEDNPYSKAAQNMINYLDHLDVDQIVTPLRGVSDFIQEDLVSTDPGFMGTVVAAYQRTDLEHKKVTNTPITSKQAWLKFMLIFMGIGLLGFVGYFGYENGWFESIGGLTDVTGGIGKINDSQLMSKYPDSASLKAAVDSGEISYDQLSPAAQKIYDEAPDVLPPPPEPEPVVEEPEPVEVEPIVVP